MRVFAIGMNYAMHIMELHNSKERTEEPVIFLKTDTALLKDNKPFFIPEYMGRIDYEAEIVLRICKLGKRIPARFAHRYYDAVTIGVDFTAREMQKKLREKGYPWDICKGFDNSAAVGSWVDKNEFEDINNLNFHLNINDKTVQKGNTSDMLYSIAEIIEYVSRYFTIKTGDILYTGTPVGVGAVKENDHLEGFVENKKLFDFYCK